MGHFGFSYVGLVFLLALFIPNLFWMKHKPKDYDSSGENRVLLAFERVGQAWVTCAALGCSGISTGGPGRPGPGGW